MRLVIALFAALTAAAASQIAIASVFAQGEAIIAVIGGEGEPAREWDIEVAGGIPSTDHVTLAPIAVGFEGEFTVDVAGSAATVTLTTVLPTDVALGRVGCLDDLTPATEITPRFDRSSFTFDVVAGRRYRCFVASSSTAIGGSAGASTDVTQAAAGRTIPRSDASSASPSTPSPGWPAVLLALVVMGGIALLLRPVRR
jgi:hypothetical protein